MTSTDFSNLIRKLSALDNQACQEVAVTAVKQAGVMVQSQARLLISSDTGALARSVFNVLSLDSLVECPFILPSSLPFVKLFFYLFLFSKVKS